MPDERPASTHASTQNLRYGRGRISADVEEDLHSFWGVLAHIANTAIFFLSGLIIAVKVIDRQNLYDYDGDRLSTYLDPGYDVKDYDKADGYCVKCAPKGVGRRVVPSSTRVEEGPTC